MEYLSACPVPFPPFVLFHSFGSFLLGLSRDRYFDEFI